MLAKRLYAMRILSLALLSGALATAVAGAADELNRSEIRVIEADRATSTCIGDPRTPVCAIETKLACDARQDASLCRKAGTVQGPQPRQAGTLRYRVVEVEIVPEGSPLTILPFVKPGFAVVTIAYPDHPTEAFPDGHELRLPVRPVPGGWAVMTAKDAGITR